MRDEYLVRRSSTRAITRAVALAVALQVLLGCTSQPGAQVAAKIADARSSTVGRVTFVDNWLDRPQVTIWLRYGATEAEAERLWCDVIVPAGGSHEGPTYVEVLNSTGFVGMAVDTSCPDGR